MLTNKASSAYYAVARDVAGGGFRSRSALFHRIFASCLDPMAHICLQHLGYSAAPSGGGKASQRQSSLWECGSPTVGAPAPHSSVLVPIETLVVDGRRYVKGHPKSNVPMFALGVRPPWAVLPCRA